MRQRIVGPEAYDEIFTMHGVTKIFWYASPILSGVLLHGSLLLGEAPHAGWFAYVPYAAEQLSPGAGWTSTPSRAGHDRLSTSAWARRASGSCSSGST